MRLTYIFSSCLLLLTVTLHLNAQDNATLSGFVKDASNGETLIGATIYIPEMASGTVTNTYGFYSLTIPPGSYNLEIRYIGYETISRQVDLTANQRIDVELIEEARQIQEVVILGEREDFNVSSLEMSARKLDINVIQKIPAFLGEVDVIRSIQLLPGVSTVGEGASGFNVRGGSVGQNLVLLDEAPVYNSSHLLGFFSVFNPDAVKDVKLYKGGIPAKYGGRIASILDIQMKEGNNKKFGVQGGVGSIFSRLTVEGPIAKDKASFIIAGRRSYADVFAKLFTDVLSEGAALNFWDLTMKTNYNIDPKNRIFLSGYLGRDIFKFDERQGFSWGNRTLTARWNHLFNDRLFFNLTSFFSDYTYDLAFGENDLDKFEWDSRIRTTTIKPDFSYFVNTKNEITFGGEFLYYRFDPANAVGVSSGETTNISLDTKYAYEMAAYVANQQTFSPKFSAEYGLRLSGFMYTGPGNIYEFGTSPPGMRKPLINTTPVADRGVIQDYFNIEPRVSLLYKLTPASSLKGSYNRTSQYIHLISNTTASNPLDVWTPSTNNIKPETGQQVVLGYFRNFFSNKIETSVEAYYRWTDNQVEYIDGADLLINEFIEGDLLQGIGQAYGLEFSVQKKAGRVNGWISYTLGRSELKVDGINNTRWYPTRFDQTHNINFTGNYQLSKRVTLSGSFVYKTGTPTTFPTTRFEIQDYVIPHNVNSTRNNVRIPNYHRLDLSVTIDGKKVKKNGNPRRNQDYMVIGVYNLYGRRNPFSVYFSQGTDRPALDQPIPTGATRVAIVGTVIPAISYNFKF